MTIETYNNQLDPSDGEICDFLTTFIHKNLPDAESKVWHAHPVWFLDGNPIVGYSKQKMGIRLMFWSGASFEEKNLEMGTGKFKDASIFYKKLEEISTTDLSRWLYKALEIQWDYKNIVKRKGQLERLK